MEEYKPIYLSVEQIEDKEEEYLNYIETNFPGLPKFTKEEYAQLKDQALKGDKEALSKIKDFAFREAFECVVHIYLNYDMNGYDFEDSISDVYLLMQTKFKKSMIKDCDLELFKVSIKSIVLTKLKSDYTKRLKTNLDIANYEETNELVKPDTLISENAMGSETSLDKKENVEILEEVLLTLNPTEIKIIKAYFGLENGETKNIREIAKMYKLPVGTATHILAKGLRKLRHPHRKRKLEDCLESE